MTEIVIGHLIIFALAGFQQYYWRARGGRNNPFSVLLLLGIIVGGVTVLGWMSLLTILMGMLLGPILARGFPNSGPPPLPVVHQSTAAPATVPLAQPAERLPDPSPIVARQPSPSLVDLAASGDANAQYEAAWVTIDGDREGGIQLLRGAAEQGHSDAQFLLAKCLLEKAVSESEFQEVMDLLQSAAAKMQGKATVFLSEIYAVGLGVEKDSEKSALWENKKFWETKEDIRKNVTSILKFNDQKRNASAEFQAVFLHRRLNRIVIQTSDQPLPPQGEPAA